MADHPGNPTPGVIAKMLDVVSGRKFWKVPTEMTRFICGWLAAALALYTLTVFVCAGLDKEKLLASQTTAGWLLATWIVLPPMFFWFDYFVLWRVEVNNKEPDPLEFEQFKHGQELSRNLWVAMVALLAAFYFKIWP